MSPRLSRWVSVCLLAMILSWPGSAAFALDADGDGVDDLVDNCPSTFNPLQYDLDGDGIGDVCDALTRPLANATLSDTLRVLDLEIPDGVTLTVNAPILGTDDLRVEMGGILRHSGRFEDGLAVTFGDSIVVEAGGAINVSGRGLRGGGSGGSIFGDSGEAYDPTGTSIVAGSTAGASPNAGAAGASYGGSGAEGKEGDLPNPVYGIMEMPVHLGSGGGAEAGSGGAGGGRVRLQCTTLVVDGAIRANGLNSTSPLAGGGSGGAIWIQVDELLGSGVISANGGATLVNGNSYSGAGGGGRIAIEFSDSSFPASSIEAYGAALGIGAAAGTIYLRDTDLAHGELFVDNDGVASLRRTPLRTQLATLRNLALSDEGRVSWTASEVAALDFVQPLVIPPTTRLVVRGDPLITLLDPAPLLVQGTYSAEATQSGDLQNNGSVRVGAAETSLLVVQGDYGQSSSGGLFFELDGLTPGVDHDQLQVTGTATLAGTLTLVLVPGFTLDVGDSFELIQYGALSGSFTSFSLPATPSGSEWVFDYGSSSLIATVAPDYRALTLDVIPGQRREIDVALGNSRVAGPVGGLPVGGAFQLSRTPGGTSIFGLSEPGSGISEVFELDGSTYDVIANVPIAGNVVKGLAVEPFSGNIFVGLDTGGGFASHLGRVDLENNSVRDLGPLSFNPAIGGAEIDALAFSNSGLLMGLDDLGPGSGCYLWAIDLRSKAAVLVGLTDGPVSDVSDMSYLGDELWLLQNGTGATFRLDPISASTADMGMLDTTSVVGLASIACVEFGSDLIVTDNPDDSGGEILLDWSAYVPPAGVSRYDIYRSDEACGLLRSSALFVDSVLAGGSKSYVDLVGFDFDLFHYRIDVIAPVAKRAADQVVGQLFGSPGSATPNVLINEFAPSGGVQQKRAGESVELYNLSGSTVDLTGWRLSNLIATEDVDDCPSIAANSYCVETVNSLDLADEGATLQLLPPEGSSYVVDAVSYGSVGGSAPSVPSGFTLSRVSGTDEFETSTPTLDTANLVAADRLGESIVVNEIHHIQGAGEDYVELFNPLGSTVVLDKWAISDGYGFLDTLNYAVELGPGENFVLDAASPESFARDLTTSQLYLYQFTSAGLIQLIDKLGWGGGSGDPPAPVPSDPDSVVVRIPDGGAQYLDDLAANWLDCGGDITLFYGPASKGLTNSAATTETPILYDDGSGAFESITAAIAGSAVGTRILLMPGTYTESFSLANGIEIVGAGSADEVVLQGGGGGRAVTASGVDETAIVSNLTIRSNKGGVLIDDASPSFRSVQFVANRAEDVDGGDVDGGAVFIDGGSPNFYGCLFTNNFARGNGGAVLVQSGDPTFDVCVFANNEAKAAGGALYAQAGSLQLSSSVLDRNRSEEGATVHSEGADVQILHSALSFSVLGPALYAPEAAADSLLCSAIHGNEGGQGSGFDFGAVITDDPQWCQPDALNYAYPETSALELLSQSCGVPIGVVGPPCNTIAVSAPNARQPRRHRVYPARPNPFNPRTVLEFELSAPGVVDLDIFDIRGRRVAQPLRYQWHDRGAHEVVWNAIDHRGRRLASGVYLARFRVDGRDIGQTQKLLLLK